MIEGPDVDPLKVGVIFSGTGADGNDVERDLIERGMPVEMADRDTLLPIVTMADSPQDVAALAEEIAAVERHRATPRPGGRAAAWSVPERGLFSPEAFFAARSGFRWDRRLAGSRLNSSRPSAGVPVLAPGDLVTEGALAALDVARQSGVRIAHAGQPPDPAHLGRRRPLTHVAQGYPGLRRPGQLVQLRPFGHPQESGRASRHPTETQSGRSAGQHFGRAMGEPGAAAGDGCVSAP